MSSSRTQSRPGGRTEWLALFLPLLAAALLASGCGSSRERRSRDPDAGQGAVKPDAGARPVPRDAGSVLGPDEEPATDAGVRGVVTTVHTMVADTEVGAGETLTVTCSATDANGIAVQGVLTTLRVTPHDDAHQIESDSFSTTVAGEYVLACVVGDDVVDADPITVRVHAGPPHAWQVTLPSGRCLPEGQPLPLTHSVVDAWNNVIAPEGYTLLVTSTPAGATLSADGLMIDGEGEYTLSVELDPSLTRAPEASIEVQTVHLHVDSTPPVVDITSPARASMLQQPSDMSTVAITGSVSDASGVNMLVIDGAPVDFTADGTSHAFTASQDGRWGLNVITGQTADECGNRHQFAQAYLLSDAYREVATEKDAAAAAPSTAAQKSDHD